MKTRIHSFLTSAVILFSAASFAASAQTAAGVAEKTTTEEFNPHWFITPQIGAAYTSGETSFSDLISPAAALYAGYRFSPAFGLRAGVSGWLEKVRGSVRATTTNGITSREISTLCFRSPTCS